MEDPPKPNSPFLIQFCVSSSLFIPPQPKIFISITFTNNNELCLIDTLISDFIQSAGIQILLIYY